MSMHTTPSLLEVWTVMEFIQAWALGLLKMIPGSVLVAFVWGISIEPYGTPRFLNS